MIFPLSESNTIQKLHLSRYVTGKYSTCHLIPYIGRTSPEIDQHRIYHEYSLCVMIMRRYKQLNGNGYSYSSIQFELMMLLGDYMQRGIPIFFDNKPCTPAEVVKAMM